MRHFLMEIGTEEMPYWAVEDGVSQLEQKLTELFDSNHLYFENLKVYGGPRRLAALCLVADRQADRTVEVRGPAGKAAFDENGNPTRAAEGFARSQGVRTEDLEVRKVNGGEYVFAVKRVEGEDSAVFLKQNLPGIIASLSFKKSMRWGSGDFRFVRPIHWIVCMLDDEVVEFEVAGIKSGRITRGHRFLGERSIELTGADEYLDVLKEKGKVVVSHQERREMIVNQARQAAASAGGEAVIHEDTLREVVQLVEWPHIITGSFDEEFLKLPDDVLITVMEAHQRYFPVKGSSGNLINRFLITSNASPARDSVVREGNERVIRARLEDARFFYNEDLKTPLESRVEKLDGVVFQKKLGTLLDKTRRVMELVGPVADLFGYDEVVEKARRAAYLLKADLLTDMVNEFDELQGIMGMEYALKQGEDPEVARAIFEHYLPRFAGDELPQTEVGRIVSVADRLDTVAGYFLAGKEPTGSEDPYSLRRQAQGVVQILLDSETDFNLEKAVEIAVKGYQNVEGLRDADETIKSLIELFKARFMRILTDAGYPREYVQALLTEFIIHPALARQKLKAMLDTDLDDILTPYQRVRNLSRPELGTEYDPGLFVEPEEKEVNETLSGIKQNFDKGSPDEQLVLLKLLRKPVDEFFDAVLVMHEDQRIRENRLKLLNALREIYEAYADFSVLLGGA